MAELCCDLDEARKVGSAVSNNFAKHVVTKKSFGNVASNVDERHKNDWQARSSMNTTSALPRQTTMDHFRPSDFAKHIYTLISFIVSGLQPFQDVENPDVRDFGNRRGHNHKTLMNYVNFL